MRAFQSGGLEGGNGTKTPAASKSAPDKSASSRPVPGQGSQTHFIGDGHDHSDIPDVKADTSKRSPHPLSTNTDKTILMPLCGCTSKYCRGTSPYMENRTIDGVTKDHKGYDIGGPEGQDVRAVADGVVALRNNNLGSSGGLFVILNHSGALVNNKNQVKSDGGYITRYLHLSKIYVNQNEKVKKGDIIGAVGHTGSARGSHLHFEIIVDGEKSDPAEYFEEGSVTLSKARVNTAKACPAKFRNMAQPFKTRATEK